MNSINVIHQNALVSLSSCAKNLLHPVITLKETIERLYYKVKRVFQDVFEKTQSLYKQVTNGLYEGRFLLLYIAATSIVALHDLPLFIGAACVGSIFALIQAQAFRAKTFSSTNYPEDVFKNHMLIQSAFSFVYVPAQLMSHTHWISYSHEGPITATLSGCMFGHIATTKLREFLSQT